MRVSLSLRAFGKPVKVPGKTESSKSKVPVLSRNGKHFIPYFHKTKKKKQNHDPRRGEDKVSLIYWEPCGHGSLMTTDFLCSCWNQPSHRYSLWDTASKLLTAKTCTSSAGCHAGMNAGKPTTFRARLSQQAQLCFETLSLVLAPQTRIIKPLLMDCRSEMEVIIYE